MNDLQRRPPALPRLNRSLSISRQIEGILREQIVSGEYADGDRLPTEDELSALYRVSRPTVRQALDGLEGERLVRREQGRGTFVRSPGIGRAPQRRSISIDEFLEPPRSIKIEIQRTGTLRGRGIVHEKMELPEGFELFYFVRIYLLGSQAVGGGKVHVPMVLGAKLRRTDLVARNVHRMLAERCGVRLGSSVLSIDAALAEPRFAELLRARAGAPLISVRRTSYDCAGASFEHSHMVFRPDLCDLTCRRQFDVT
jgi:GntR family transcriptional regulator